MTGNVEALFGGPTGVPEPDDDVIAILKRWLMHAEAGEVVGVAIVGQRPDRTTLYATGGKNVSFGMIGSLEVVKSVLVVECLGHSE